MSDVVARMRALCEGGWHKGDELWDALAAGAAEIERLRTLLSGAQYREREARNEVAVLRARLDGVTGERCPIGTYAQTVHGHRAPVAAGDLAGLGRREALR